MIIFIEVMGMISVLYLGFFILSELMDSNIPDWTFVPTTIIVLVMVAVIELFIAQDISRRCEENMKQPQIELELK